MANAVIAYAANCDKLDSMEKTVELITEKHVSFNVLPEHYEIVGTSMLKAIKKILGEAATDEIVQGWEDGYWFLANLLMNAEEKKKKERENVEGKRTISYCCRA